MMTRSRIFHLYGDTTVVVKGVQNLGQRSALMVFEQVGRDRSTDGLVFAVSFERPPYEVDPYDKQRGLRTYSACNRDPYKTKQLSLQSM
jgi:hypothetical protein